MVYGDEIGAGGERAFHHQGRQRRDDLGPDMAATEHGRAHRHEVGDRVVAISDELYAFSKRRVTSVRVGVLLTSWRLFAMSAWTCQ